MKSCSEARTWRVATTPSAVSRNRAPVNASREKSTGELFIVRPLDFRQLGDHGDDGNHERGAEEFGDSEKTQLGE